MFGAPFLILVGGGGTRVRRLVSAAVGGVLPVAALLLYTQLTTGSWLHPGYDYQYQLEANGYPTLGYHPDWSVEDLRYIPQNLGIMFGALPVVAPDLKPNTLGFGDPVVAVRRPRRPAVAVRPRLPAGHADRHRHQHPAERARPADRPVRRPAAPAGAADRRGRR